MRTSLPLIIILSFLLSGISSCEKWMCCSDSILGNNVCIKGADTLYIFTGNGNLQTITANTLDTFDYYTSKGYSCTQNIEPNLVNSKRVVGNSRIKQDEQDGYICVDYSTICEP